MRITNSFCRRNGNANARLRVVAASFLVATLLSQLANGDDAAQVRFRNVPAAAFAAERASDETGESKDARSTPTESGIRRSAAERPAPSPSVPNNGAAVQWRSMATGQTVKETAPQPATTTSQRVTIAAKVNPPPVAAAPADRPVIEQKATPANKPNLSYDAEWDAAKPSTAPQSAAVQRAPIAAYSKPASEKVKQAAFQAPTAASAEDDPLEVAAVHRTAPALKKTFPALNVALQPAVDAFAAPPNPSTIEPMPGSPFEIIDETGEWTVTIRRSKLLRTPMNIYRTAVVDTSVCDVVQFTPREVSIIGRGQGATHVTFWFEGDKQKPITYLVRVVPDPEVQQRREKQYRIFEEVLAELFPDSKIHLLPIADKLIVKGQAKDGEEAAQIMAIIRGEAVRNGNRGDNGYGSLIEGRASDPIQGEERDRKLPATQVVNMLRIPGIQQVALRVKIAELNRTAARNFGVDLDMKFDIGNGSLLLQSMLNAASGGSASVLGHFNGDKVNFGIHFLEQHGVVRLLSEPTLVTMSGRPASFVAGGEFAVPTTVGISGASAVTTEFRSFGAIISFLPTVLDKDRIRLEVAPEFSKINNSLAVNNTPGLDTRAVTTTVEMREGQTLAIAGLLDDAMKYESATDLPILCNIFGKRTGSRNETELMILVTPELVQPMDPEEVPPLPGFDVSEPSHNEFYFQGQIEGRPTRETRSTVWPTLRRRYQGTNAMMSGPFGHGQ